jgi:peroxiredoxin Q/BCP
MSDLKAGDLAPDFELASDAGTPVKLSDYRGKRVVLYFYPKDDTPGCTAQACSFRDHYADIEEKNAIVLGISVGNAKSKMKFRTKYNLPFTLLADEENKVADAYGVWQKKKFMGKEYMGIERSQFVIDEQGVIVDARKVKPDESLETALAALG